MLEGGPGGGRGAMASIENGITIADGAAFSKPRAGAGRRRKFWLSWVAAFGTVGIGSGVAALGISLLTACSVLRESRGLGVLVSSMLIGCLGALLLAAHGMDRLAAVRRDG